MNGDRRSDRLQVHHRHRRRGAHHHSCRITVHLQEIEVKAPFGGQTIHYCISHTDTGDDTHEYTHKEGHRAMDSQVNLKRAVNWEHVAEAPKPPTN